MQLASGAMFDLGLHLLLYFGNNWALRQQNLSLRFLTKKESNHPAQLQRLARKLKCP